MTIRFSSKVDQYAWLSNFYPSPIHFGENPGEPYATVEHAYQISKIDRKRDDRSGWEEAIFVSLTPQEAKRIGRKVPIRPDWGWQKDATMEHWVRKKFQIPELREKLLATGEEELVEETYWHDQYWGICSCPRCGGAGQNKLGKIIMKIRSELLAELSGDPNKAMSLQDVRDKYDREEKPQLYAKDGHGQALLAWMDKKEQEAPKVEQKEVPMTLTRVVNIYPDRVTGRTEPYDVYIGRAGHGQDGYFGNPFTISEYGSREASLAKYEPYFLDRVEHDLEFREKVLALKGKILGCFCPPEKCHGHVIAAWLDQEPQKKEEKMAELIVCGTGHRPKKLKGGYSQETYFSLVGLCRWALEKLKPSVVITGGALGFDQALAQASLDLGIPYDIYIPFEGFDSMWPIESQNRLKTLMATARKVLFICEPGYEAWKMQRRNEAMVQASQYVLCLWNGTPGGTNNCVQYAHKEGKKLGNLWEKWESDF